MLKKIWLKVNMCIENRRLREIQHEKKHYAKLLNESDKISDCLVYQGKLESLKREEEQIVKRYEGLT